ncbi:MAG: hypothetical protein CML04_03070 [Pseudozobellia sp.]|nr:hypothetical protein [Pseudozobellia sp.]MBG49124.1 hypothetical protein [Pseudozobellia sp.]
MNLLSIIIPICLLIMVLILLLVKKANRLKTVKNQTSNEVQAIGEEGKFFVEGLRDIFQATELVKDKNNYELASVLGYFATSLFDKNSSEAVLWDISQNCISQLGLEDCVIYLLNEKDQSLEQKAAFGNKHKGQKQILSPIKIPMGKGIVGEAAASEQPIIVADTSLDKRYILDDKRRYSELAVPIIDDGVMLGVLDSEHSTKGFFTSRHLALFRLIAKLTAIKLQRIEKKSNLPLTNGNAYYKEFRRLLIVEKIYRNPDVSLTSVSEVLNISATYLSQLVNKLENQSFTDSINRFRVSDAEEMLADSDFNGYTVVSLGLEAGFNSKSSFYLAFKKYCGMTPTEYRKQARTRKVAFS